MPGYTPTVWENAPSTATPIDATRLQKMEQGIADGATPYSVAVGVGSWLMDPSPGGVGLYSPSEAELQVIPRYLPAGTYDQACLWIDGAGSAGAVFRMAFYADAAGAPGALIGQSVAIDATATGSRMVTLVAPLVIPAGGLIVHGGAVVQGAAATRPTFARSFGNSLNSRVASPTDFFYRDNQNYYTTGVTGALPAPWTSTSRYNDAPKMAFRRSA